MKFERNLAGLLVMTVSEVVARDVPSNVKDLYNRIRDQGECENVLAKGFRSSDDASPSKILH
jgi:hypothetical protein